MSHPKDPLKVYFDLMLANGAVSLYKIVGELKLFEKYTPKDLFTLKQFCADNSFKEVPTLPFLNSLVAIGLLNQNGEGYMISPVLYLLKGHYQNLSTEYWSHLPTLLKTGEPFKKMDQVSNSEQEYQAQVKSLEWMMTPSAQKAVEIINVSNSKLQILDVGAGSGVWSFNFLYKNPGISATVCDWPLVLKVAKESAERGKISERVSYIEGNYHECELGTNQFDYAILGNVTHIETISGNKALFKKIAHALNSTGKLLIFDSYGKQEVGELARSLYQLGLTIRTVQGKVYSSEEMNPWLREAGFNNFAFHSLDATPQTMGMLVCSK
jgi:ubiquinone/menaquinone biosynthesis C-methylase UbiE